jgi:hypothetical protein
MRDVGGYLAYVLARPLAAMMNWGQGPKTSTAEEVRTHARHRPPACPDDYEFTLIELRDSPIGAEILGTGRYMDSGLKHFRIGFDDHGVYDIVCESLHTEGWEGPELQHIE